MKKWFCKINMLASTSTTSDAISGKLVKGNEDLRI